MRTIIERQAGGFYHGAYGRFAAAGAQGWHLQPMQQAAPRLAQTGAPGAVAESSRSGACVARGQA